MRILFSSLLLFYACISSASQPVGVRANIVQDRIFQESFTAIGKIRQGSSRSYRAAGSGEVDFVLEKTTAKKGDIIISTDGEIARATLDEAKLDASYAKAQLERDKKLLKRGVAAREVVEQSEVKFKAASMKAASAQRIYQDNVITAPFDADIIPVKLKKGDKVQAGDLLCKITERGGEYKITLELPEKLLGKIDDSSLAYVQATQRAQKIPAKIKLTGDSLKDSGSFTAKILIDNPKSIILRDGAYATVTLLHSARSSAAVPEKSIMLSDGGHFVYKINGDNVVEKISVTPGVRESGYSSLLSGDISKGDRVITQGMVKVKAGAKVTILSDNKI